MEASSVRRARNPEPPLDSQKLPVPHSKEKEGMLPLLPSCLFFEGILKSGNQGHTTFSEKKQGEFFRCKMGPGLWKSQESLPLSPRFPSPVLTSLLSSDQRGHREWTGRAWDKSKRMLRPGWVVVIFHPLKNSNENAKTQTAVMVYLTCPPWLPHACRTTTKQFYTQQRQNPPLVFSLRSFFYSFPFLFFILFSFTLNHCSIPRKLSLHSRPWAPAAESDASEHGWRHSDLSNQTGGAARWGHPAGLNAV